MFRVRIRQSGGWFSRQVDRQFNMLAGRVSVGVFGRQSGRLVVVAGVHEFGSVKKNIPKRSFLQAGLEQNQSKYREFLRSQVWQVLRLRTSSLQLKRQLGTMAVADVQRYMVSATFVPLKPATVKRKGSSKPLIDSGRLRQSISYQVE